MLLGALCAVSAWSVVAGSTPLAAQALVERLELEGALDNDTDLGLDAAPLAALREGDGLLAQAGDDAALRTAALESWRRALLESSPDDAVFEDERNATSVARALERRLGTELRAAFRARFEGLAEAALHAAGADPHALLRAAYEHPFTRAGATAELRRFDLLLERGDTIGARAAAARLGDLGAELGPDLERAIAVRARTLTPPGEAPPAPFQAARGLRLEATFEVRADESATDRFQEPGAAAGGDGRVWVQSGERLIALDEAGAPALFELRDLVAESRPGASWVGGFGERERAWPQRPACEDTRLALVLGRAKEGRGNALAVFDTSRTPPALVWIHHDGLDARDAPLAGLLEYQPGPLAQGGLVIAQVYQWHDPAASGVLALDGRRTHVWLLAFDARDGRVAWRRELAYGADRRGRALDRFDQPRATSIPALPLEPVEPGEVLCATELGVLARVSAWDGRLVQASRLKRVLGAPGVTPGSGGPFVRGSAWALAPADAGGSVYRSGELAPTHVRVEGLERLVGATSTALLALVRREERVLLRRVEPASGRTSESLPLPRGARALGVRLAGERILVACDGALLLFDSGGELTLLARLELDGLASERHVGLWTRGGRVYVLGTRRIWIVRGE